MRRSAAQALVECALVLPIMVVLTLGVLQVILYAHAHDVLLSAVQEGARLAAEDGRGLDEGYGRVESLVRAGLGSSVDSVRLDGRSDRDVVTFQVSAALRPIVPLPMRIDLPLRAEGHVTRERFRPVRMYDQPRFRLSAPVRCATDTAPVTNAASAIDQGVKAAALAAVLLVPLAGAAEPPQGWATATLAALTILLLVPMLGSGAPWGWFGLLTAITAVVTPRGHLASIGPALFVATLLCVVLWFANRGHAASAAEGRPPPGSAHREAQVMMGLTGERHVSQVLARELPQEYVVINGLKLPRGAGDIDQIVVGPSGVFVVETKTMAGRIECDAQGTWRRTRVGRGGERCPAYIGNPSAQVQRNIFAARECLRRRAPALFVGLRLWIEGLVVFPHPRTELATEHSRVPAVRLEHAVQHICGHTPRRALQPHEIDTIVESLLAEGAQPPLRLTRPAQSAQALVEMALALPIVLGMLFGTVAVSRLVQAQTAVIAVAHEAARAGTLASGPEDAVGRMHRRIDLVAPGLGLDPHGVMLEWDVSTFERDRGHVLAVVSYAVDLHDLPLAGWAPRPMVRAQHVEWVDPFRSGLASNDGVSR